jgi:ribonuclease Z
MTNPPEVIFLGVGSAIPMRGGTNASYLLRLGSETMLIDCGPAILQQLDAVGVSPREISHIFVTHRHGDHALGYPMLMLWYQLNPSPSLQTPILIASEATFVGLDELLRAAYSSLISVAESAPRIVLPTHAPSEARIHPNIMLRTWPMKHSDFAPVLGLRIEIRDWRLRDQSPIPNPQSRPRIVLAFTGDTSPNDNIALLAQDADLLVHDTDLSATIHPQHAAGAFGHSTAQIAARNAKAANAKHLALVHIDNVYEGQVQTFIEEAQREFAGKVSAPVAGAVYGF